MSDSRERFEAFWLKDVPKKHRAFAKAILDGYGPGYVGSPSVSGAWGAWQAAERDALERAAKVCEEVLPGYEWVFAKEPVQQTCAKAIRALAGKE